MAKEKPPRKRLIAPDSDDEASAEAEGAPAEATKEPEEGEDPAAEEEVPEGEVDLKSVAARLRTEIAAPDDDTPVAPETFAPILEALGELKTADPLANPRLAEKAAKAKVLDALFALLEDAPRAIPPKKAPTKASTGSNADAEGDVGGTRTAEDEADEDPDEDPPPPTEAERRAARVEAHRRAKYDALALPATRALAHLCGSHAAFRNDVGTQVVRVGTVFAALRPHLRNARVMYAFQIFISLAMISLIVNFKHEQVFGALLHHVNCTDPNVQMDCRGEGLPGSSLPSKWYRAGGWTDPLDICCHHTMGENELHPCNQSDEDVRCRCDLDLRHTCR